MELIVPKPLQKYVLYESHTSLGLNGSAGLHRPQMHEQIEASYKFFQNV